MTFSATNMIMSLQYQRWY